MSRPKAQGESRRVITDMTFPAEASVNAYIVKNSVYGIEMEHSLPTVDALAQELRHSEKGIHLSTLVIAQHYCDVTVPFGARASSFHMQSIANAIVDMLAARNIKSYMYLDDLIIVSTNREQAERDFKTARELLRALALPEAPEKAQPPSTRIKWLGVIIDTEERSLAIPEQKLSKVLQQVSKFARSRSMNIKQLRSILGLLLHVAKCVRPARIFISRLLEALREAKGWFININADMRADFQWFEEFCNGWNGKSYIPDPEPSRDIYVDACLSGVGATDGTTAYSGQVAPIDDPANNITELEALNVVVALHTLLSHKDKGSHIRVHCDNKAAVQVLQSGRARNKLLLDCARAAWMVQAVLDIQLSYVHVPGKDNEIADRLSRAHLSENDHFLLEGILQEMPLNIVEPCLHIFHNIPCPLLSRSGHPIVTPTRRGKAALRQSTGDMGQPGINNRNLRGVRQEGTLQPHGPQQIHGMRLHRVPRGTHSYTSDNRQQGISPQVLPHPGGGRQDRYRPPHRRESPGGPPQKLYIPRKKIAIPMDILRSVVFVIPATVVGLAVRAAILIMYFGALRQSEVAPPTVKKFNPTRHPTRADVTLTKNSLSIHVKWAKNMQRVGQSRTKTLHSVADPRLCPVHALKTHYAHTPTASSTAPMLTYQKSGDPIPISVIKDIWGAAVRTIGADITKLSLHSLRKAAATQAHYAGCGDLRVQRLGGWKSNAFKAYIADKPDSRVNNTLIKSIL